MVFGRKIKMEFERVKVSPEMIGIVGGWLAMLAFLWSVSLSMNELHADMSDLRTELKGDIAHLNERMARVEGLLEGYIEQSRAGEDIAATE